jgi:ATP-dependent Clp protease ATP-binding subunit ClpA
MFERFTNLARRVIVLSQEEARGEPLRHNYIGTEHLLLGLLGESRGLAAKVLSGFGMTLENTREAVRVRVGVGEGPVVTGHIPFTPRAKKVLELALREALQLNHTYIGTEHLLLGLVREGNGAGAEILAARCGNLEEVRSAVLKAVRQLPPSAGRRSRVSPPVALRPGTAPESDELPTTPAADTGLEEAVRLAGGGPVGSHHLVLAALADPGTAAARALAALGIDLDQARAALRAADVAGSTDELPQEAGRRQLQVRLTGDSLTMELTDPVIVGLGRAALDALGDRAGEPPAIRGDLPVSTSLATVWLALQASLEEIRQRAAAETEPTPPSGPPPDDQPPVAAAASGPADLAGAG